MLPGAQMRFVASERGAKRTRSGSLALVADHTLSEIRRPDVVVVPGGPGEEALRANPEVVAWLRSVHETSRWTTSVCTGALLLAAAGLLDGVEATTHWASMDDLAALGARPVKERVVVRGKVVTAAGVSAGIDMALRLAQLVAGDDVAMAIQLVLEYDPQPPFDAGSPDKAPASVLEMVQARSRARATR
jgi:transcriptional regulator GlxA family with amidase domain